MIKVRIKKLPKARTGYQVQGALANDSATMGGADYNKYSNAPKLKESKYITSVPRDEANLEAEGGETVYGDINGDGFPEHKIIKGPRHSAGGVPLNLPEDTFIFSDTRGMLIKDPELLNMFGKGGTNKSYTPAELAKQYDVQKYRVILEDPDSDEIERKTAELMIKKYVIKLGCLALAQESKKGFPQGIPAVAKPCMEARGLTEQDVMPNKEISVLNDQLKKQMDQKEGGDENMLEQAVETNDNNPVAEPTEEMAPGQGMQQQSPEEMMMNGGYPYRRLKRAQQGMQQPSEEEMMMMMQQQQQQPQQGGDDQMQQVMQQVGQALQQGTAPEEVAAQLIQSQIPPEQVAQIFVQLGMPEDQVQQLIGGIMQQMQGAQQEMMRWGGQRRLRRAQQGMGQPSEEEMMMQQQAQGAPQQEGGQEQMQQIMQQVGQALEQGAKPEEVIAQLLQGQIPPEAIMQIFVQLGMPEEQVGGLIQSVMGQLQGGQQQMQQEPQQEPPMSQEEMMRYGGMRRLKRAQEGMQQPSPEEMAMMQQQQGQGQGQEQEGGDEMMQIIQEVKSALERGAEPAEVVMNLLQNGLPPESIVEIFAQLGASPEEAAGLVQQVMQQAQGGGQEQMMSQQGQQPMSEEEAMMMQQQQMQQAPMAQYGMAMGGYNMPFAQDGLNFEGWERIGGPRTEGDPNIPWQADYNRNVNASYIPKPPHIEKKITNWIHPPNLPDSGIITPYDQWADMHNNPEKYKSVELSPEELNIMNQELPVERIELPQQQYGGYMELGGYDMPFYDMPEASRGMTQNRTKRIPLRKAQDGIEIPYDPKWDTDPALRTAALKRAYAQAKRKGTNTKVFVVKDGKKVEQKISAKGYDKYSGADLASGWNGNQVAAATYEAMKETFNDDKAKAAFATQVRKTLTTRDSYKGKTRYNADGTPKPARYSDDYKTKFGIDPNDKTKLSDDKIVEQYLRMQERNLKTSTMGVKVFDGLPARANGKPYPFGSWMYKDGTGDIRVKTGAGTGDKKGFKEAVKEADPDLTDAEIDAMYTKISQPAYNSLKQISTAVGLPMNWGDGGDMDKEAYLQQAGFIAADALMKDIDANPNNYDEETLTSLLGIASFSGYSPYGKQSGYNDESGMGVTNISPIDGYYTNTTQGENQGIHDLSFEDIPDTPKKPCASGSPEAIAAEAKCKAESKEFDLSICSCKETKKKCPCEKADGSVIQVDELPDGSCPCDQTIPVPGPPAEWWLQDTIKTTGAFADKMGIKKYMPWSAGADLETPRPTFLDPTRELGANAEQAKIQTQGMAQFAGPQALSARSSGIQGQASKNAADILSKYNNANVNLANQFELKRTDVRNQESMLKQASSQRLYDQNTVANQQFDNAKLAMRGNLRNQYTNAITNRWKTDALNQMNPNYAVSSGVGGRMNYIPGNKQVNGQGSSSSTQEWEEAFKWCKANGDSTPSQCADRKIGVKKGSNTNQANNNAVNTMGYPASGKYGGQTYKDGGFVHIDSWLPFIK